MLDLVNKHKAWLTYARNEAGTKRAWRCYVSPVHFTGPDIMERAELIGYGRTASAAIQACFK